MALTRRHFWLALLTAASLAFSYGLACAAPLAAFAAVAALTLSRRDAFYLVIAVWLANQLVGFTLLDYPATPNSLAWGVALGGAAIAAMVATRRVATQLVGQNQVIVWVGSFLAAFAVYQAVLIAVAVAGLGGLASFAPVIVFEILMLNAMAFAGLYGAHRIGLVSGLVRPADNSVIA